MRKKCLAIWGAFSKFAWQPAFDLIKTYSWQHMRTPDATQNIIEEGSLGKSLKFLRNSNLLDSVPYILKQSDSFSASVRSPAVQRSISLRRAVNEKASNKSIGTNQQSSNVISPDVLVVSSPLTDLINKMTSSASAEQHDEVDSSQSSIKLSILGESDDMNYYERHTTSRSRASSFGMGSVGFNDRNYKPTIPVVDNPVASVMIDVETAVVEPKHDIMPIVAVAIKPKLHLEGKERRMSVSKRPDLGMIYEIALPAVVAQPEDLKINVVTAEPSSHVSVTSTPAHNAIASVVRSSSGLLPRDKKVNDADLVAMKLQADNDKLAARLKMLEEEETRLLGSFGSLPSANTIAKFGAKVAHLGVDSILDITIHFVAPMMPIIVKDELIVEKAHVHKEVSEADITSAKSLPIAAPYQSRAPPPIVPRRTAKKADQLVLSNEVLSQTSLKISNTDVSLDNSSKDISSTKKLALSHAEETAIASKETIGKFIVVENTETTHAAVPINPIAARAIQRSKSFRAASRPPLDTTRKTSISASTAPYSTAQPIAVKSVTTESKTVVDFSAIKPETSLSDDKLKDKVETSTMPSKASFSMTPADGSRSTFEARARRGTVGSEMEVELFSSYADAASRTSLVIPDVQQPKKATSNSTEALIDQIGTEQAEYHSSSKAGARAAFERSVKILPNAGTLSSTSGESQPEIQLPPKPKLATKPVISPSLSAEKMSALTKEPEKTYAFAFPAPQTQPPEKLLSFSALNQPSSGQSLESSKVVTNSEVSLGGEGKPLKRSTSMLRKLFKSHDQSSNNPITLLNGQVPPQGGVLTKTAMFEKTAAAAAAAAQDQQAPPKKLGLLARSKSFATRSSPATVANNGDTLGDSNATVRKKFGFGKKTTAVPMDSASIQEES